MSARRAKRRFMQWERYAVRERRFNGITKQTIMWRYTPHRGHGNAFYRYTLTGRGVHTHGARSEPWMVIR